MDPVVVCLFILLGVDILTQIIAFFAIRIIMNMPIRKAFAFSSVIGTVVGILAAAPYFMTHVLHAVK